MGVFDGAVTENRILSASSSKTTTMTSDLQNNDKAKGIMVVLDATAVTSAVNEVQNILIDATGGTYTITFGGQTTSAIAYNADPATTETALRALSSIGGTNVACSGSAGNINVTFQNTLAATDVALMTTDATSLTGGAQTATITQTTAGVPGSSLVLTIKGYEPTSNKPITLLTSAAVTSVSTNTYRIYPGLTAVTNVTVSDVLPKTFLVVVTPGNASPTTYSVGAMLLA